MYVIGTAGHVDHGKPALVTRHRALKYAASSREPLRGTALRARI